MIPCRQVIHKKVSQQESTQIHTFTCTRCVKNVTPESLQLSVIPLTFAHQQTSYSFSATSWRHVLSRWQRFRASFRACAKFNNRTLTITFIMMIITANSDVIIINSCATENPHSAYICYFSSYSHLCVLSDLTLLAGNRKGIRPVKNSMLVCSCWP